MGISIRDIVLIVGGVFLLVKGTLEIRDLISGGEDEDPRTTKTSSVFWMVIAQIAVIDIVFSLDSVITAVGIAQHIPIMVFAILLAVAIMLLAANPLGSFIDENPTIKMLALAFIVLVGAVLILDGFGRPRAEAVHLLRDGLLGAGRVAEPADAPQGGIAPRARRGRMADGLHAGLTPFARALAVVHAASPSSQEVPHALISRSFRGILALVVVLSAAAVTTRSSSKDEAVKAGWSEVLNQYKRRADLIPNLVNDREGLCRPGSAGADRRDRGPRQGQPDQRQCRRCGSLAQFQAAQGELSQALGAPDDGHRELSEPEGRPALPSTCRPSWKAPRTASPSRAAATSSWCRTTTPTSASSRST